MTLAKRSLTGDRVARLPASGIRRFFDLAAGIPGVISLGVGEPDFVTPDAFREAAIRSIKDGKTQYTSNYGLLALREAITRHVRRVLAEARWNKKLAAQLLGIHRRTLYRLTKRYGIPLGETRLKPSATSVASTATRPLGSGDAGSPRGGGRDGPVTV